MEEERRGNNTEAQYKKVIGIKNILFIITDQQRKDALGCYNDFIDFTPNIDSLAKRGILFENAIVSNPICTPNRISIFSGRHVSNHGVYSNGLITKNASPNLIQHLKEKGYQTASFGKIHFEPFNCEVKDDSCESSLFWKEDGAELEMPYHGFEKVELTIGHTLPLAHYGRWFYKNGGKDEMLDSHEPEKPYKDMPVELHDSTFVAERTIDFLKNSRDKERPFFAVASFPDPHFPFNPPKEYYEKFKDMEVRMPLGSKDNLIDRPLHYMEHAEKKFYSKRIYGAALMEEDEVIKNRIRCTHAMNNLIDDCVGRILDALEEEGLVDDTLVIYTSDHGEHLGDFGLWYKGPFFFDSLLNTPLILSNPALKAGHVIKNIVSSVDIMPTALDLIDVERPLFVDGHTHKASLLSEKPWLRDYSITEYRKDGTINVFCYTDNQYRFVYYEDGQRELTDRVNDPFELRDISKKRPDIVEKYEKKLLQAIVESRSDYPRYTGKA